MSQFMELFRQAGGDVEGVLDRFMDDEDLFKACLEEFSTEKGFDTLANCVQGQVYKEAFEAAHALKGIIGNLGILPLYNSICVLVESLRGGNYDDLEAQLAAVLAERDNFLQKYELMK